MESKNVGYKHLQLSLRIGIPLRGKETLRYLNFFLLKMPFRLTLMTKILFLTVADLLAEMFWLKKQLQNGTCTDTRT